MNRSVPTTQRPREPRLMPIDLMMCLSFLGLVLATTVASGGLVTAQPEKVSGTLRLRCALVLEDGTALPAPLNFPLLVTPASEPDASGVRVLTGPEDSVVSLPPGDYVLTSEGSLVVKGRLMEWTIELTVIENSETLVELTNDNATVTVLPRPDSGSVHENVYRNEYSGFQYELPEAWIPLSENAVDHILEEAGTAPRVYTAY